MDDDTPHPEPTAELGDGPPAMSELYRLASAADRALIDEALSELLHTLDRMPSTADEPWLAEAWHDAEDAQRTFREIRRAEAEQERNSSRSEDEDDDEGWVPVITE